MCVAHVTLGSRHLDEFCLRLACQHNSARFCSTSACAGSIHSRKENRSGRASKHVPQHCPKPNDSLRKYTSSHCATPGHIGVSELDFTTDLAQSKVPLGRILLTLWAPLGKIRRTKTPAAQSWKSDRSMKTCLEKPDTTSRLDSRSPATFHDQRKL